MALRDTSIQKIRKNNINSISKILIKLRLWKTNVNADNYVQTNEMTKSDSILFFLMCMIRIKKLF